VNSLNKSISKTHRLFRVDFGDQPFYGHR
jgi:hypothetical protein